MAASTAAVATADFIELDLRFKRAVDVRLDLGDAFVFKNKTKTGEDRAQGQERQG